MDDKVFSSVNTDWNRFPDALQPCAINHSHWRIYSEQAIIEYFNSTRIRKLHFKQTKNGEVIKTIGYDHLVAILRISKWVGVQG